MRSNSRLAYLDQYRGYTVLGMFFVNFVGGCLAVPAVFKHHNTYCSYADTIMPQFLLAVGFAYRLTWRERCDKDGARTAYLRAVRRNLGLILLGVVVYHLDGKFGNWASLRDLGAWGALRQAFQRNPFQTLVHIGLTSLWVLPVIGARPAARVAFLFASAALFVVLSHAFYYDWVMSRPGIDGGPLGFLTWTVPLLVGSLACDAATDRGGAAAVGRWLLGGALLMLLGYGLSCLNRVTPPNELPPGASWSEALAEPPFVPPSRPVNVWTMSQRAGSVSYLLFGAGFALAVLALFAVLSAMTWLRIGYLDVLGRHALAGYVLHDLVGEAVKPYTPKDAPLWYALSAFAVYLAILSLFLRHLDKHKLYLRL